MSLHKGHYVCDGCGVCTDCAPEIGCYKGWCDVMESPDFGGFVAD